MFKYCVLIKIIETLISKMQEEIKDSVFLRSYAKLKIALNYQNEMNETLLNFLMTFHLSEFPIYHPFQYI